MGNLHSVTSNRNKLAAQDAFGKLRVSQTVSVWDNKNIHDRRSAHWQESLTGGGTVAHNADESSVELDVGTADGDAVIRQTHRYLAYVPGRSQAITVTGVMSPSKTNLIQRIGYFDALDGLFFELNDTALNIVVRTSTSGSAVDTLVAQSDWNLDTLDGSSDAANPSGVTLDISKAQIFKIDFEWLGVGQIRYGFDFGGDVGLVYTHQVLNANTTDKVYMSTPTLPIRYEIRNNGVVASASKLKEICTSVDSEGGYRLPGYQYTASNGVATRSITARTPILAVRLQNSFGGKPNRKTIQFLVSHFYTGGNNDAFFEVVHVHTPITDVGGTWVVVAGSSAAEFNVGLTSIGGSAEHILHPVYVPTGQGGSAEAGAAESLFVSEHDYVAQNIGSTDSQVYVIYATPLAGTSVVGSSLAWIEFD